ncbi:MAG: GSCFA domain-containing protein [Paludibacteraceae bacterium]|nr:GSCFA domain-containing protein [Paludibacteraceae bacterium]MBQ9705014.1 GSCFA domain-containing protein [Paludibacteraceae bacterium]
MQLTTPVHIAPADWQITYQDRLLLLGSCFTDHIGRRLEQSYFRVAVNPFGVLYNPLSIAQCLEVLLGLKPFSVPQQTVFYGGLWHSMLHHGSFSSADRRQFEAAVGQSILSGRQALEDASVLLLTFGTAWVYEYEGEVVANCHKLPASAFTRRRLQVDEVVEVWRRLLALPQLQGKHVVFTVSPIRHLKDGLHENQLSKATLLLALDRLGVGCFPAYEIMQDELRDYRFYAADMVHPSDVAVDYIWERFCSTYFSENTRGEMRVLQQLYHDRMHRPLHPDTEEYRHFCEQTEEKARVLREKYPWI